jgi:hypothetical protein
VVTTAESFQDFQAARNHIEQQSAGWPEAHLFQPPENFFGQRHRSVPRFARVTSAERAHSLPMRSDGLQELSACPRRCDSSLLTGYAPEAAVIAIADRFHRRALIPGSLAQRIKSHRRPPSEHMNLSPLGAPQTKNALGRPSSRRRPYSHSITRLCDYLSCPV